MFVFQGQFHAASIIRISLGPDLLTGASAVLMKSLDTMCLVILLGNE
jgi:hypothetical protein